MNPLLVSNQDQKFKLYYNCQANWIYREKKAYSTLINGKQTLKLECFLGYQFLRIVNLNNEGQIM